MADGLIEEVQRVVDAMADVKAIEDPLVRAQAITQLLAQQAEMAPTLRDLRRDAVLELRAQKVSLRKIAAMLGVSLGAVQDMERGHSGAWGTKPRKKPGPDGSAADPE